MPVSLLSRKTLEIQVLWNEHGRRERVKTWICERVQGWGWWGRVLASRERPVKWKVEAQEWSNIEQDMFASQSREHHIHWMGSRGHWKKILFNINYKCSHKGKRSYLKLRPPSINQDKEIHKWGRKRRIMINIRFIICSSTKLKTVTADRTYKDKCGIGSV